MRVRVNRRTTKRMAVVGTAAAALATTTLAMAPTASADSYRGCDWPRVCFYLTSSDWGDKDPTAAYQDVTTSYQDLGSRSRGADHVTNTRNDDRVYLRYIRNSTGATSYKCVPPNHFQYFSSAFTVTGIRIDTASSC
ncbi:hypothetical protein [Streptomyces flaveus]|uniref:Peptidase inhibitor family I36 n=1 Tax=Streptomyces flaveus TaxID=66370 RepID=A0A917QYS0_9ACTN|nr:hypothetical protein [Streptomyces flaveus]GGK78985.1 hypothetical protein GCM10010094_45240 [Streptomyces flaveus]